MSARPVVEFSLASTIDNLRGDESLRKSVRYLGLACVALGATWALGEANRLFSIYVRPSFVHFVGPWVEPTWLWRDSIGGTLLALGGFFLFKAFAPVATDRHKRFVHAAVVIFAILAAWQIYDFVGSVIDMPRSFDAALHGKSW